MKRLLLSSGVVCFCFFLSGCGNDSREGLISDTISMLNQAAKEIDDIRIAVDAAAKESQKNGTKLDLKAAIKAADKLKQTGDKTLEIKARIEMVKAQITDEDKKVNAENKKEELETALKNVKTKHDALLNALADAAKLNTNAAAAVDDLRKKYVIAQSPFEALTR